MELSRLQEEILICLGYSNENLCESEILEKLNCDRAKDWKQISQPLLNKTLARSTNLELVKVSKIDTQNYNRKYYQITHLGHYSLMQARDNRKRLGAPDVTPLNVLH